MTKEQEAIEKCKEIIQQNKEIVKQARLSKDTNAIELTANCNKESIAIETVLNMLKEKDKEINRKSSTIKALQCALHERTEERDRKDNIITRQNKQIDLMAEHIVSSAIVDDTVCAIKCDCETDIEEDCTHEKMLICTKQYFEKLVKEKG